MPRWTFYNPLKLKKSSVQCNANLDTLGLGAIPRHCLPFSTMFLLTNKEINLAELPKRPEIQMFGREIIIKAKRAF